MAAYDDRDQARMQAERNARQATWSGSGVLVAVALLVFMAVFYVSMGREPTSTRVDGASPVPSDAPVTRTVPQAPAPATQP